MLFFPGEIKQLTKLVDPESTPDDVLEEEEKSVVTNLALIRDSLFVPKHSKYVQTIRLKKLVTLDFDLPTLIKNIGQSLSPNF